MKIIHPNLTLFHLISMHKIFFNMFFKNLFQTSRPVPKVPKDRLLAELLAKHPDMIWKYHDHDSLLENQVLLEFVNF